MSERHHDHHDHDHDHPPGGGSHFSDVELRVKALEYLLVEKRLVNPAALEALIDTYETKVGPRNGARVVARAWVDPEYKRRLLADASAAIAELGYTGRQGEDMVMLENTPAVHNMVVCALCCCYPWPALGLPPVWYKSAPYRSRRRDRSALRAPRVRVALPDDVEVRVWDSTAELRYLVLPERPPGTEGMRGAARRARHARRHDRSGAGRGAQRVARMNGVHDLGGMHGFGPVVPETDEPVFHHEWERRASMARLSSRTSTTGTSSPGWSRSST